MSGKIPRHFLDFSRNYLENIRTISGKCLEQFREVSDNFPKKSGKLREGVVAFFRLPHVQEMSGKCPGFVPERFQDNSRKCPGNFRESSRTFPGKFLDFFRKFAGHFPGIARKFFGNFPDISWTIPGHIREMSRNC